MKISCRFRFCPSWSG